MRRVAATLLLVASLPLAARAQEVRQVRVAVVAFGTGEAVGFSVVAAPALGIERFAGASGVVVVAAPPGELRLSVKRLGFVPKDTLIVVSGEPGQSVVIALERLVLRLNEVRVEAWPPCAEPGIPRQDRDPQGWTVVEQLRQNAERFDLLVRTYPFLYTAERTVSARTGLEVETVESVDTILVAGDPPWEYRPGAVLRRQSRGLIFSSATYAMRLPTLRHFASRAFLDNHCFHVAGIEDKAGQRLLRMDIVASQRLRDADVNVAVWLDTADFRLRFATLALTRIPNQMRHLERLTTEITYLELLPYVPVMYVTVAENVERGDPLVARRWYERQQVLDVRYLGAHPDSARPDEGATRPPPR